MEQHSSDAGPLLGARDNLNINTSPLSQPARRLQLRRAGFRAAPLPSRRISPLWGAPLIGREPFLSPHNMLQEIQNTVKSSRTSNENSSESI